MSRPYVPRLLMQLVAAGANEAGQHPSDLEVGGSAGDRRIGRGEGANLFFVLSLDHAQAPGTSSIQNWTKYNHPTRVYVRLPMGRMASHDLTFLIGQIKGERRTGSLEPEDVGGHAPAV